MELLNTTEPSSVKLDEAKAEQILSLTNNMLLLIRSQTPITKTLLRSCQFTHLTLHYYVHFTQSQGYQL